jgi:hypothetical protein
LVLKLQAKQLPKNFSFTNEILKGSSRCLFYI